MTNWRAMQVAGSVDMKNKREPLDFPPSGVLTRYLTAGSRHADLSKFAKKSSKKRPGLQQGGKEG